MLNRNTILLGLLIGVVVVGLATLLLHAEFQGPERVLTVDRASQNATDYAVEHGEVRGEILEQDVQLRAPGFHRVLEEALAAGEASTKDKQTRKQAHSFLAGPDGEPEWGAYWYRGSLLFIGEPVP